MIFNIQNCSIHDGTGLRTLVFLKGCPLHCPWCANPESQLYTPEITEIPRKCIGCGACEKVCPESAISLVNNEMRIDRSKCIKCFKCTEVCYAESKEVVGREIDVDELFNEINKDRYFYQIYGGGVTFSGGEPLTYPEFLTEIAKKCKKTESTQILKPADMASLKSSKKRFHILIICSSISNTWTPGYIKN